ncbi:hypothetical protein [Flagellimonas sp. 2504JD4-2]
MKSINWIGLAMALCLVGCSSDDQFQENSPALREGSFIAVGEDLDKVFQYNYNAVSETGATFDLTQELNISTNYITLRQREDLLSFYSFAEGRFSLVLKNVLTGQIDSYPDFYTNIPDRSIVWGVNDDSKAFFAYIGPVGSRNLGILEFDLENSNEKETTLDFNISDIFAPLLYEDMLYISYVDGQGNYKLAVYQITTGAVLTTLNFEDTPISLLISDLGELIILKGQPQTELEKYDAKTLTLRESISLNTSFGFLPGPLEDTFLSEEKIFFNLAYAQPSRFAASPAIYDFSSQETRRIDLFALVEEVEEEIGRTLQITTQIYNKSEEVFLVGYGTLDEPVLGGVFQISLDGDLLDNITLPFFPGYFLRN